MLCLKHTRHENTAEFLASALGVARYYGFVPIERIARDRLLPTNPSAADVAFARRDERSLAATVRAHARLGAARGSALLVSRIVPPTREGEPFILELHVIGVPGSVGEAFLIAVTDAIAADADIPHRSVAINSIGTTESSNRFVRDTGLYLRKHLETIAPSLRARAVSDPLGTMVQLIEKKHPGVTRAPQSMEYLIEEERRRFWEFIEYLEAADITYELDPLILGSRECWSHTLFEVRAEDASGARVPFAFGGRYDPLAGKIVGQPAPSAMAAIPVELHGKTRVPEPACITPTLYFAHLGTEARRRSFRVIEILRQAGIPIHQSLLHERLGDQMVLAKRHGVPFILIIGHKEAVEGTVLVREVATNEQEAVPTDELVAYLRRHRIAAVA